VRDGRLAAVIDWGCAGRGDPAISGWTYYRDTAPEISRGALETVERLIASLDG
jgi:aminoglycoside phosphotransferase (APT) family kinase protein